MAESLRDIKQRIKSVSHTGEIARAMEAVSASKMRKAQLVALHSRPYATSAFLLLLNVRKRLGGEVPFLLQEREAALKEALLVITSDKGLAGAYNSNVLKKAYEYAKTRGGDIEIVIVGKKARDFFRARNIVPIKEFYGFGDFSTPQEVFPLSQFFTEGYGKGRWKKVCIAYTNFKTTLKQEAVLRTLLPIDEERIKEIIGGIVPEHGRFSGIEEESAEMKENFSYEYKFEPSPEEILEELLPHLFLVALYHIILECNASEHSARMVAMKNASDNAHDILKELTLYYNKARQSLITRELAEITGGAVALEQ